MRHGFKALTLVLVLLSGVGAAPAKAQPTVPNGYVVEQYVTGIGAANALAFGPDGLLYITDYQAGRLLRRTCSGALEVVASGLPYAVGVAITPAGRVFVAAGNTNVYEIVRGVPRVVASGFSYVTTLAIKGDHLYVSNSGADTISKISITTGNVSTELAGVVNPHGMSIDSKGDMYVISHSVGKVYRYDFVNPPTLIASIPAYSGTYTGEGFDGLLFWGQYGQASLHRFKDGSAEVFGTGFAGGAGPPVIGPNGIVPQGSDAILVADGHDVWRISKSNSSTNLANVKLNAGVVAGCKTVIGSVVLSGPAPLGGLAITLSDTMAAASTASTLKMPAGATCKTFSVKTMPVTVEESGTVSATLGGTTLSANLTVRPIGLSSLTLSPTNVVGGQPATGTAKLECKAGPGPVEVLLSSSNAAAANPVAASIFVPQGLLSAPFDVATNAVPAKTTATIVGTANGITKSKALTVTPAATVSPTSLKFGSVSVNTTSAALNATLTNKGVTAFAVNSIGLTGTNAKYYARTNNCPANLAAGASCTVAVTFKPTVTGSKSATLSIATSATSAPLKVTLSGTGL